jgi:hypothetical protein
MSMDAAIIEEVLRSLFPHPWGWQADLPGVRFLGQPLGLRFDTREAPAAEPPPPPDDAEVALARQVLGGLSKLLPGAEEAYRRYHAGVPGAVELAHEPIVWVSRSTLAREGPGHWALVVGIAGAEDYGTHMDFAGLSFLSVWSGD